jgi:hypothetical protein
MADLTDTSRRLGEGLTRPSQMNETLDHSMQLAIAAGAVMNNAG